VVQSTRTIDRSQAPEARRRAANDRADSPAPPGPRTPGAGPQELFSYPPKPPKRPKPFGPPPERGGPGVVVGSGGGVGAPPSGDLGAEPPARQYNFKWPQSVEARFKSIRACAGKSWTIATWRKDGTGKPQARRFECRSWRHSGECRRWKGAHDYARIRKAIADNPGGWVYMVLTFDPSKWKNEWAAYRGAIKCWAKLRKRIVREFAQMAYLQTWERHKGGFPHVNILIRNQAVADECAKHDPNKWRWLKDNAAQCGFGWKTWIEPMKRPDAMAGYLTKLSRELVGADSKDQVPVNAPRHFRRLRASRGLLPPPQKNAEVTGCLIQAQVNGEDLVVVSKPHRNTSIYISNRNIGVVLSRRPVYSSSDNR